MLFNKPPLAVPEQIRLLQGRGMVIADEVRAARVLQHINYYRLRAYWLPFEALPAALPPDAEHAFRPGTDFDNVVSEVIGPLPQIAPKKHMLAHLWHGGMRCR